MSLLVRAFPLKANVADLEKFTAALNGPRKEQAVAMREVLGVTHESWYLQETESGPWVIALSQVEDVAQTAPKFAAARDDFPAWFKDSILQLTGVDTNKDPLGPPTRLVYEWSDTPQTRQHFAPPQL
jgi:hypothetical protein